MQTNPVNTMPTIEYRWTPPSPANRAAAADSADPVARANKNEYPRGG